MIKSYFLIKKVNFSDSEAAEACVRLLRAWWWYMIIICEYIVSYRTSWAYYWLSEAVYIAGVMWRIHGAAFNPLIEITFDLV